MEALTSEAEGQELGAAGGVAVDQRAKTDLVGDAGAGEALGDHTDHDAEHGGAAVEALDPLELLAEELLGGAVLKPLVVGGGVGHGCGEWQKVVRTWERGRWGG